MLGSWMDWANRNARLAAALLLASAGPASGRDWRADSPASVLSAARLQTALLPAPAAGPAYAQPADWPRVKALCLAELAKLQSWNSRPEVRAIVSDATRIGRDIEAAERAEADRKIELFGRVRLPDGSPAELAARAELVFASRMLYIYGFLVPQAINEGFEGVPNVAGLPFPLYHTNADFCRDWAPLGWELRDAVTRAEPAFFPPDPNPGPGVCAPAETAKWRGLRPQPLPR